MSGMIDRAGAQRVVAAEPVYDKANASRLRPEFMVRPTPASVSTVTFEVVETHDGVPCDCIDKDVQSMTLKVGESIELTHTCHDGRVDVVRATVVAVSTVPTKVEHVKVTKS